MSSHCVKSEREKRISPKGGCPSEFDQVMRKMLPTRTWRQDKKEKSFKKKNTGKDTTLGVWAILLHS